MGPLGREPEEVRHRPDGRGQTEQTRSGQVVQSDTTADVAGRAFVPMPLPTHRGRRLSAGIIEIRGAGPRSERAWLRRPVLGHGGAMVHGKNHKHSGRSGKRVGP